MNMKTPQVKKKLNDVALNLFQGRNGTRSCDAETSSARLFCMLSRVLNTKTLNLILASLLMQSCLQAQVLAMSYEDLNSLKPPAYRVGTSDDVEQKANLIKPVATDSVRVMDSSVDIASLTYADLSIKKISAQIAQELDMDYDEMLGDLSMLWQGAATRSDIIKFALYKLSNPEADKPDEKSVKKVLQTIANMSTLVGAGVGSPILSGGSFVGGNILGIMSQDDKEINYRFTKVNDADMIILVRKVDELQQEVVNVYYDYSTSRKMFEMTSNMVKQRYKNYQHAQNSSREIILISDAYYRESLDMQMKARSEFYSKRASMEQLVGNDVFVQFEEIVNLRESNEQ